MWLFYDFIFLIVAAIYLPIYFFKGKFHKGFLLRLGIFPKDLVLGRPIWVHAVSVGEVMAVKWLVEELRKIYPQEKFIISTVTATGNKIARSIAKEGDFITYLPLDFSFIIKKALKRINPSLFIIAETEIWPNLVSCLAKKNIPVIIVNGRVSDASFKRYSAIKVLIKTVLVKVGLFCVQTERDASRLVSLGAVREKIKVTGNMKFDTTPYTDKKHACLPAGRDFTDKKVKLGLKSEEKLLVAGSTHPGEEEVILGAYKKLSVEFSQLRLMLAPRHPERSTQIIALIKNFGFEAVRVSQIVDQLTCRPVDPPTVFILDTIGELMNYYAISDIVFVGGSLVKKGGHNIIEPAFYGKPIIFGPHMFNFRDIADLFLREKAALQLSDQKGLVENIRDLLKHPVKGDDLGSIAKAAVTKNQGATAKTLEYIKLVKI